MKYSADGRALPMLSARLELRIGREWPEPGQPHERFDPDEVTARVGIEPTLMRRQAELVAPRFSVRSRADVWALRVGPQPEIDLGLMLQALRQKLQPGWERLVASCAEPDLMACVACVVQPMSSLTPIIAIEAVTLQWIVELDAYLDIDVLSYGSTDEEDEPE